MVRCKKCKKREAIGTLGGIEKNLCDICFDEEATKETNNPKYRSEYLN